MDRGTDQVLPDERPVFVADGGRRAAILRCISIAAAGLTAAWLVALLTGAFGFGRLPAVPFPPIGALHEHAGGAPSRGSSKRSQHDPPPAGGGGLRGPLDTSGADNRPGLSGTVPAARRSPPDRGWSRRAGSPDSLLSPKRAELVAPVPSLTT